MHHLSNLLSQEAASGCVLVSHSGKQHAYRHALAVQSAGRLGAFATSSYFCPGRFPDRLAAMSSRMRRWLERRRLKEIDETKIHRRWLLEAPELMARMLVGNGRVAESFVYKRDAAFDKWVAKRLVRQYPIYWGFQGSCRDSLKAAREAGSIAVAEFAIAHVSSAVRILSTEAERHPEWAATISNYHFPDWYRERLEEEPLLADVCVAASSFTRQSLLEVGVPDTRILTLPLGADLTLFKPKPRRTDGVFRVLFVGGVGQRKGIKYLLDAYKSIAGPSTELVLCGPLPKELSPLKLYDGLFEATGRVDQSEVIRQMYDADVLVLPSVFEGFGLVIVEAMATGMPVIASTHSCGPEVIRSGVDGFVLEPDDVEGIADRLQRLHDDRLLASQMGANAATRAAEFSWVTHANNVKELLQQLCRTPEYLK